MVVIDIPVYSCQNTIGGRFQIIVLPWSCGQTILLRHKVRKALKFRETGSAIRGRIWSVAITCHYCRASNHIVLILTINEKEELILQDGATKGHTKGRVMAICNRKLNIANLTALQRRTGQIGIG